MIDAKRSSKALALRILEHDVVHRVRSPRPYPVSVSMSDLLADELPHVDWADAYAVVVSRASPHRDPQEWADAIFKAPPPWIKVLFGVRELLVHAVGIERGGRAAFDTVSRTPDEVVLGVDQGHLAFRASVRVEPNRVVLTTLVKVRNRRGAAYFAVVSRVHPLVVRSMLARAARALAAQA